jgi:hypothetical protein
MVMLHKAQTVIVLLAHVHPHSLPQMNALLELMVPFVTVALDTKVICVMNVNQITLVHRSLLEECAQNVIAMGTSTLVIQQAVTEQQEYVMAVFITQLAYSVSAVLMATMVMQSFRVAKLVCVMLLVQ